MNIKEHEINKDENSNFYKRADKFIHLANDIILAEECRDCMALSLMYAAARYFSYAAMVNQNNVVEMAHNKEDAINNAVEAFKDMCDENYDQYTKILRDAEQAELTIN